ncbi:MAG: hypothetical protein ACOC6N_02930 [archaeon]
MSEKKLLRGLGQTYQLVALIIFIAFAGLFLVRFGIGQNIVTGRTTMFEGVLPSFHSVYYEGVAYDANGFRGTQMDFDVDDPNRGLPDLEGEMTSIFLPVDVGIEDIPDYVPKSRAIALQGADTDPVNIYTWQIDDTAYRMEEYDLKWFVSMEAGYDTIGRFDEEGNNQRWKNAEIWIRLDTSPTWYFEGADKTYFTVAKIKSDYVEVVGLDANRIDVSPEAIGTSLSLFYRPWGESLDLEEDDFNAFAVGETHLNPEIFRNELYTVLRLDDFGSQAEGLVSRTYQGDIVTWEFTVKTFVVGEWKVQDVQDPSELEEGGYIRTVKKEETGLVINWDEVFSKENKILYVFIFLVIVVGTVIILYGLAQGYGVGMAMSGGRRNV